MCFFHWRSALREQLKKKGCAEEASASSKLSQLYKWICSLPFVPQESVLVSPA